MTLGPFQAVYQEDGSFRPLQRFHNVVAAEFDAGEVVTLERREERSAATHRHFFACLDEAWSSLPEHLANDFASPDHLRKRALILTGFRDERSFACASRAEAIRLAAFLRPIDDYALVAVKGTTVVQLTAKSQSARAMGKDDFARSKAAVLGYVADLIGSSPRALDRAGAAA